MLTQPLATNPTDKSTILQKQYIFIYRALMEVAQYGDTEIQSSELKSTIEKLRQCDKDGLKSKMEEDFEVSRNISFCRIRITFDC